MNSEPSSGPEADGYSGAGLAGPTASRTEVGEVEAVADLRTRLEVLREENRQLREESRRLTVEDDDGARCACDLPVGDRGRPR